MNADFTHTPFRTLLAHYCGTSPMVKYQEQANPESVSDLKEGALAEALTRPEAKPVRKRVEHRTAAGVKVIVIRGAKLI